jgi:hypothetical protein
VTFSSVAAGLIVAGWEALRAQLKKAGCRVTALDQTIAEESGETDELVGARIARR